LPIGNLRLSRWQVVDDRRPHAVAIHFRDSRGRTVRVGAVRWTDLPLRAHVRRGRVATAAGLGDIEEAVRTEGQPPWVVEARGENANGRQLISARCADVE
jgi:hypothetical protein